MEIVTHAQLRRLVEAGTSPAVSIFMPTHRQGRDVRQDPVRLKNLLREAEDRIVAKGIRPEEGRRMLEEARKLLDDGDFWMHNDEGLALFIGKDFFTGYKLPVPPEELVHVNDRFEIKPLLPMLEGKMFYVLAVSKNDARLLECTPHGCHIVRLPEDVSLSVKEAVPNEDEHQTHLMRHSSAAAGPNAAGSYHGQVVDIQASEHEDQMFYFRQLDEGVRRVMSDPDAPVVLAGVDSVTPFYRRASQLKHIVEESIEGNPEHVANERLHQQALEQVQQIWHKELNGLQEQFGNAIAHQRASNEIEDILPAAASGRVGILFVSPRATYYGKFDSEKLAVMPADQDDVDAEDLVDRATMHALMTGAQLVVVEPDQVPGNKEVGAIYRY